MKDAKGHGSDARSGVSSQATAVKGLVNMIRSPAAHQEGIRSGVPMTSGTSGDPEFDKWQEESYLHRKAGAE